MFFRNTYYRLSIFGIPKTGEETFKFVFPILLKYNKPDFGQKITDSGQIKGHQYAQYLVNVPFSIATLVFGVYIKFTDYVEVDFYVDGERVVYLFNEDGDEETHPKVFKKNTISHDFLRKFLVYIHGLYDNDREINVKFKMVY